MVNSVIQCAKAPAALGVYSQAIFQQGRLYVSGQVGIDTATGEIPEDFAAQAHLVMQHLKNILAEAGMGFDHVVKTTVLLEDIADFAAINEIYGSYFTGRKPARSCFQVAALPRGAKLEIELIAENA